MPARPVLLLGAALFCGVTAALSLLIAAAPDYDAWAYLTWGREVTRLELSTTAGPAFKPLPVAICALIAPLGPDAWLFVVRAAALAAVALAIRLAWELTRSRTAAAAAAGAVVLTGDFVRHAAVGNAEPLLCALALGALAASSRRSDGPGVRPGLRGRAAAGRGLAVRCRVRPVARGCAARAPRRGDRDRGGHRRRMAASGAGEFG